MSETHLYDAVIPSDADAQNKRARILALRNAAEGVSAFVLAIVSILALCGIIVVLFLYEFKKLGLGLFTVLLACFACATLACALAAFFLMRLSGRTEARRRDFLERCDSPESFFVGEGTLMTFTEEGVRLHGERGTAVEIPYAKLRFFSVCTRKRAHEKGEWSIVIEMPASYLAAKGEARSGTALIQTDRKDRLLSVLSARGLELLGEQKREGKAARFKVREMFFVPDPKRKRRALFIVTGGGLAVLGGILTAIFFEIWAGVVISVFGLFLCGRGVFSLVRSRSLLAFYEEGMYWTAAGRTDSVFLKWEEIEKLSTAEQGSILSARCAYGSYRFPCPAGAWAFIEKEHREKI